MSINLQRIPGNDFKRGGEVKTSNSLPGSTLDLLCKFISQKEVKERSLSSRAVSFQKQDLWDTLLQNQGVCIDNLWNALLNYLDQCQQDGDLTGLEAFLTQMKYVEQNFEKFLQCNLDQFGFIQNDFETLKAATYSDFVKIQSTLRKALTRMNFFERADFHIRRVVFAQLKIQKLDLTDTTDYKKTVKILLETSAYIDRQKKVEEVLKLDNSQISDWNEVENDLLQKVKKYLQPAKDAFFYLRNKILGTAQNGSLFFKSNDEESIEILLGVSKYFLKNKICLDLKEDNEFLLIENFVNILESRGDLQASETSEASPPLSISPSSSCHASLDFISALPRGIKNGGAVLGGNMCYLIASLQALFTIDTIRNQIKTKDLRELPDLQKQFLINLRDVLKLYETGQDEQALANRVAAMRFEFFNGQSAWGGKKECFSQQDAQQFVDQALDFLGLHFQVISTKEAIQKIGEEYKPVNIAPKKTKPQKQTMLRLSFPDKNEKQIAHPEDQKSGFIATLVKILQVIFDFFTCNCRNKAKAVAKIKGPVDVQDRILHLAYPRYNPDTDLKWDNGSKYAGFNEFEKATGEPPPFMLIHMNRNKNEGKETSKINTSIALPSGDKIDLSQFWETKGSGDNSSRPSLSYRLVALLIHEGSRLRGGHYFSYVRRVKDGTVKWYRCDDATITPLTGKEVKKMARKDGYLLFFERINRPEGAESSN